MMFSLMMSELMMMNYTEVMFITHTHRHMYTQETCY